MTRNFSPLSLNAPWNCVTIRLQKPSCQWEGGLDALTTETPPVCVSVFAADASLGTVGIWIRRGTAAWIWRLLRVMRSVDTERPPSKALACGACRVESRTRRSGGMADAADSKSVGRKAVWVRLPPPAPCFLQRLIIY